MILQWRVFAEGVLWAVNRGIAACFPSNMGRGLLALLYEAFQFFIQTIMKTTTRVLSLSMIFLLGWVARGADIGFIEKFALAKDRKEALKLLIPGTTD
ncbi:uncharacterized protein METZ01_LOCUS470801, partial [marine metagenome]